MKGRVGQLDQVDQVQHVARVGPARRMFAVLMLLIAVFTLIGSGGLPALKFNQDNVTLQSVAENLRVARLTRFHWRNV